MKHDDEEMKKTSDEEKNEGGRRRDGGQEETIHIDGDDTTTPRVPPSEHREDTSEVGALVEHEQSESLAITSRTSAAETKGSASPSRLEQDVLEKIQGKHRKQNNSNNQMKERNKKQLRTTAFSTVITKRKRHSTTSNKKPKSSAPSSIEGQPQPGAVAVTESSRSHQPTTARMDEEHRDVTAKVRVRRHHAKTDPSASRKQQQRNAEEKKPSATKSPSDEEDSKLSAVARSITSSSSTTNTQAAVSTPSTSSSVTTSNLRRPGTMTIHQLEQDLAHKTVLRACQAAATLPGAVSVVDTAADVNHHQHAFVAESRHPARRDDDSRTTTARREHSSEQAARTSSPHHSHSQASITSTPQPAEPAIERAIAAASTNTTAAEQQQEQQPSSARTANLPSNTHEQEQHDLSLLWPEHHQDIDDGDDDNTNNNHNNSSSRIHWDCEDVFLAEPVERETKATTVTLIDEDDDKRMANFQIRRLVKLGTLVLLLVLAGIIVIPVALIATNKKDDDDVDDNMPVPPVLALTTTASPSAAPTTENFSRLIAHLLGELVQVEEEEYGNVMEAFRDPSTPQYKALVWLSDEGWMDGLLEDDDESSSKFLLQRYILAVFFHAVLGEEWLRCRRRDVDSCPAGVNPWMSSASDGENECTWLGVLCNDDGFVTSIDFDDEIMKDETDSTSVPGLNTRPPRLVKGILPKEMGLLSELRILSIPGNKVQGSIESAPFVSLKKLRVLDLGENQLTGRLPESVLWPEMANLNLGKNDLKGTIPVSITKLVSLEKLVLAGNPLSGEIPRGFDQILNLVHVDLQGCSLRGEIPLDLYLPSIETLKLGGNPELYGSISDVIASMKELRTLDLSHAHIGGEIPRAIYQLDNLEALYLENTRFSGMVSQDFRLLNRTLQKLSLKGNDFHGLFPDAFDHCRRLEYLDLSENPRLSGSVSEVLCAKRHDGIFPLRFLDIDCAVACECCGFRDECNR